MNEHDIHEAWPALRAELEEIGAKGWTELVGMKVAWGRGTYWLALGETFAPAPGTIEGLDAFLG
ncbi:hypothetical protein OV207_07975 [Corallococcus sp. BB11-1]|uniref:hypothetical protein n=1 Tax=Corallococcus sp. BB11-1 TaxID=2996783 RepID=UPI0022717CD5|nr:hypothetical protein [Corallococcus sp. BB11-1]MCY1031390.1 hypothetical protein [Corallococcus sp. BB11-1]